MKLTLSSEMGIHAVWYLATLDNAEPVLSADVARGISVSESYLIKVLKKLVSARILTSRKGKRGGYMLRKKPAQITLADIVGACEGTGDIYSCQKEDRGCLDSGRCPICITLTRASEAMYRELNATRIADLLAHGWTIPSPATMPV
jgi:Rrf2 family protein